MPRKTEFCCRYCSKWFDVQWKFIRHERCHTKKKPFGCQHCEKGFTDSRSTSNHEKRCRFRIPTLLNTNTRKRACKKCGEIFDRKKALKKHKKKAHPLMERCECGMKLEKTTMEKHKLRCSSISLEGRIAVAAKSQQKEDFPCGNCSRSFKSANLLDDHRRGVHGFRTPRSQTPASANQKTSVPLPGPNQANRQCVECGACLRNASYRQHVLYHALTRLNIKYFAGNRYGSDKVFMCRYITCFLAFPTQQKLAEHEEVHMGPEPYMCGACDKLDVDKRSHKEHVKHCASRHLLNYPCGYCGKFFGRSGLLWRHYQTHRPDKIEGYTCGHCGEKFPARFELNKHNSETHQIIEPQSKDVVFQCNFCPQKLISKEHLLEHAKTYHLTDIASTSTAATEVDRDDAETKTFNCMYCCRSFTSESRMRSHERIHTNEKPHACPVCGLAFTFKRTLQKHLRNNCSTVDADSSEGEASSETDSSDSDLEIVQQSDDEVISISSSPSPSPSTSRPASPPPSPKLESVQIQRLDPVPVTSSTISANGLVGTGSANVYTTTSSLPSPRDKIYLIQYDQAHQGPLTVAIPNKLAKAAIRILPTGQNDPADPVPMKLERVL